MDFRILTVERMVVLSAKWLQPPQRTTLERYPETAALLNKIKETHEALFVLTNKTPEVSPESKSISEKQKTIDVRHDDLVVALQSMLTALARRASDPVTHDGYIKLRDHLFPDGASVTKLPYAEEGGAAILLERRLTGDDLAKLKSLAIPGEANRTFLDDVLELITQAKTLLSLEEQKKILLDATNNARKPSDELKAKQNWIRAARSIEANLELAGASNEDIQQILGDTYAAVADTERKHSTPEATTPVK